ncbi:MAG: ABC transporter permease [Vicinamibacteria bacterium]|nr:ABC transporter permease [Vicinamibacteria bacterium]
MLPRTLLATGLRDLLRRPLHTALLVLGVALGVAVVVAIDLAGDSARRAFVRSTDAVIGRATHAVHGGPSGVPVAVYRDLRRRPEVSAAAPVVEATAFSESLGRTSVRVLGIDPIAESPFRDHLGGGSLRAPGFSRLFTEPAGCVISAAAARRHGLALGGPLRLRVDDRALELRVLGLIEASPDRAAALEALVLLDVGVAQSLLGLGDRLTRVDLILASDADPSGLAATLPPGLRLAPASEQAQTAVQLTEAFHLNLGALSLLALVVGMFLIYNTITFSVVQRRTVFGTLRLLGATPGQVFGLILAEAALASAVGTLAGEVLGYALGQGAVRLVTRTINDLYFVLAVGDVPMTAAVALRGALLGMGAGLLAALPPALEASRVEPVAALRPSTYEGRARVLLPRIATVGLALALCGAAGLGVSDGVTAAFASLFAIVLGTALAVPLLTATLSGWAAAPLGRVAGSLGRIAARTVERSVSRTGVAVAALMTAVSVTVGVSLMIASFRATVVNWLELTIRADLYVGAPSGGGVRATPAIDPALPARLRALPGVADLETIRRVRVASGVGEIALGASELGATGGGLYRFAPGSEPDPWARVQAGSIIVSEPFAHRHRLAAGARLEIHTDRGPVVFPVAGVFYDYSTEEGQVLMARAVYERHFDDRAVSSIAVHAASGTDLAGLAARVREAAAGRALFVTDNRSLKREALRIFDRTFAVTDALRLLAVAVAFVGVWSALMALHAERTRELATLQALGLTPGLLRKLGLLESGLMGALAGLLSLPLGALLAWILVDVINVRSFGWTMELHYEPWLFVQALALSLAASLLATVYPLWRLGRREIAAALRHE